jgi:hypothetical protein
MADLSLDRRKAWRHAVQCAIAEERARQQLAVVVEFTGAGSAAARTCQVALDAEGVRLDAAIDALDEMLTPTVLAPANAFPRLSA